MPSPRPSGSSSSAGRSSWRAVASGSRGRSRGCASASSRAPSGPTPRQIRSSSGSRASGSGSSRRPPRRRSSSATATPSSSRRSRSSRPRSTPSPSRAGTWRAPRSARYRSRSAGARRARRRCATSGTPSSPSGSAGWHASFGGARAWPSRTSPSGTSATSPTRRPSVSSSPTRSSHSTTCSTASPGSWKVSSCGPSGCAGTSRRASSSSSASACSTRSSSPVSRATTATASSSGPRCARGRRSSTSASSAAPTTRSPRASTSTRPSTSAPTRATSTPCSTVSKPSRRSPYMPETHIASGKVRDIYAIDDERLLLVASDRISTFDVVLPTEIPDKGRVLTGLSGYWFTLLGPIVPNHMLSIRDDGRSMECRRLEMLPIECVVRGYLAGSGWKDYRSSGEVCGHQLPEGLQESDKLPEPIFTPATKAIEGHDENITREQAAELVGAERFREVEEVSLRLYKTAADHALRAGLILADTKFELGLDPDGDLVLGDGALTPDSHLVLADEALTRASSRSWPGDEYDPGRAQDSFDKQFVRDYCETTGWDKTDPGPELPDDVVQVTRAKYHEAFERLTTIPFPAYLDDPTTVLG